MKCQAILTTKEKGEAKMRLRTVLQSGLALTVLFLLAAAGAPEARAGAVIVSGSIALGVNDQGHLNTVDPTGAVSTVNASGGAVGLAFSGIDGSFRDATAPGCLCEGWGVSGSGHSGYASVDSGGISNLTVDSFTSSASSITSSVHLTSLPGLTVSQVYAPSVAAPLALFEDKVTITNLTGAPITELRYVRVMDWDIPTTEFSEFVTIKGTATTFLLEKSHDDGFETPNPLASTTPIDPTTEDVDFTDNGPNDHGAYFRFMFGDLAAGESYTFSIFYGAAESEAAMLAALSAVGIELFSLGQSSTADGPSLGTPATFAFGFKGVGGTAILPTVPEPGTVLLLGAGIAGLLCWRRRRNS
jgi:type IV pilus assembly protein PilY1